MQKKLSIGSWAFAFGPFADAPWTFTRILDYASEAGYDGVEINGFAPHPIPDLYPESGQRKQLAEDIRSRGLGISAYAPDFSDVPPAIVDGRDYVEKLKRYIAFAQDLGTTMIRVDSVSPPEALAREVYDERFHRLVDTWSNAASIAEAEGMTIAWEFEPGFWLNKPSEVVQLVQAIESPAFGVLFDTSHAYMSGVVGARHHDGQEILPGGINEYFELLADRVVHLHLIDSDGTLHDDETSTHSAFGSGFVDFASFLTVAKPVIEKMDWWCVDFCFNAEVEAWGKEAVPFLKNQMNALAAKEGK